MSTVTQIQASPAAIPLNLQVSAAAEELPVYATSPRVEAVAKAIFPELAPAAAEAVAPPNFLEPKSKRWTMDNFLKRIPIEERTVICQEIQRLLDDPSSRVPDAATLLTIDPHSPIDYRENNVYILYHYLQGNIDKFQASRLLLYDACREHVALAGQGSPEATPVVIHDLVGPDSEESFRLLKEGFPQFFDEKDWECLKTVLRENPDESWDFFAITHDLSRGPRTDMIGHLLSKQQRRGFIPAPDSRTAQVLLVPPLLWTRMLEGRFGEQRMKLNLVLGYRNKEQFSKTDSRVVGVPCAFVKPPQNIHFYTGTKIALYVHDASHHIYIESANPHRELWAKLALTLRDIPKHEERYTLELWLDREFGAYAGLAFDNQPKSAEACFWRSMSKFGIYKDEDRALLTDVILEKNPSLINALEALGNTGEYQLSLWQEYLAKRRANMQEEEEIQEPDVYSHGCFGL